MKYNNCPICNNSIEHWKTKKTGDSVYNIDMCKSCGFTFVNPRPDMNFLMNFYSLEGHGQHQNEITTLDSIIEQEKKFPNSTIDAKRMITTVMNTLNKSAHQGNLKLLDVGCGYGFFSKEAIKNGFEVNALELASTERNITNQMTGLQPVAKSFEEFESGEQLFDVILMSQILEHAFDINLWVKKACKILKPNGVIAIALPNFNSIFRKIMQENDPFICPPAHLNFFSSKSLSLLLSNHGFKVSGVQYVSRIPKDSIQNRLSRFGKIIPNTISNSIPFLLSGVDYLRLGMIINVYAQKI
jgi:2-polyprenyl-3-methyl-5-hydroxy-6-metoxy-1,4-benzoquinol methylase